MYSLNFQLLGSGVMENRQIVEKIRKFNRFYANQLGKIDQEIYNKPFPLTEARVITEIHTRKGCTATEVREQLGIDRGYMSRIVKRLERERIIDKRQSATDKREYLLYLTNHGEAVYQELVENANREVGKMIQVFSQTELQKLTTAMENVEAILSRTMLPHDEVKIRSFQPGDVGYVAHLHGRFYEQEYKFGPIFEYYVMKGLTEFMLNTEGGALWVAEVNGQIVGSIAITKASNAVAQLRWYVLDGNFHGLGIGRRLIETALSFCKQQGYKQVFLWTVNILHRARALYQKNGFKLTEQKVNLDWTGSELMEERWNLELTN